LPAKFSRVIAAPAHVVMNDIEQELRGLVADEQGGFKTTRDAALRVVLAYPSPYDVAMSSLGYQQIYRLSNERTGTVCERAMLPSPERLAQHRDARIPLLTLEHRRPAGDAHVIAISQAYELELTGVVSLLRLAGLAPRAADRTARDPLVVLGGPITFSNPLPSAPLADLLLLGEAEDSWSHLLERLETDPQAARGDAAARQRLLESLVGVPGFYVPSLEGERLPAIGQASDDLLPAHSTIWSPRHVLSNMFLIEPERGCHRGCTFCVMRRTTNGGMRLVSPEKVLEKIPAGVPRVGLVGAAVTDHPRIKQILRGIVEERGLGIGISSLRADRLDDEFVSLLARGGYRSMTVALDAASVRLREEIEKNIRNRHIEQATELAKAHGMRHLKVYVVAGYPGETDEDLEELVQFIRDLRRTLPVVLGISPLVAKFRTPLADAPFAGEKRVTEIFRYLRGRLRGQAEVRGPGPREAYIEYRLAQGGFVHAEAAIAAEAEGSGLGAWRRALAHLPERHRPSNFSDLVVPPTRRAHPPKIESRLRVLGQPTASI
jgi:radical SAM superfamily enzyme YgiQ (UPF0313 family)